LVPGTVDVGGGFVAATDALEFPQSHGHIPRICKFRNMVRVNQAEESGQMQRDHSAQGPADIYKEPCLPPNG
jgi:hypothetical protein